MFWDYETADAVEDAVALAIELADEDEQREEWPALVAKLRENREFNEARRREEAPIHAMIDDGILPDGLYASPPRYPTGKMHAVRVKPHSDERPKMMRLLAVCGRWQSSESRERLVHLRPWPTDADPEGRYICRRCAERARDLTAAVAS